LNNVYIGQAFTAPNYDVNGKQGIEFDSLSLKESNSIFICKVKRLKWSSKVILCFRNSEAQTFGNGPKVEIDD